MSVESVSHLAAGMAMSGSYIDTLLLEAMTEFSLRTDSGFGTSFSDIRSMSR